MGKKGLKESICPPLGSCQVAAIVSVDERGQMVLPKEVRDKAGIRAGDKMAVICLEKEGTTCCISLVKTESFAGMVKGLLGPMMQEALKS